jgi:hypothetical protein
MNKVESDPLATPDFFPMKIDPRRNTIQFDEMSRSSFRESAFLDRRAVRAGNRTLLADMARLKSRQPSCPLQFILHVAFCGSTLLARYLEELPHCLVLKEPKVLGQLADTGHQRLAFAAPDLWHDRLSVVLAMLARGYPTDVAAVVKAPDMCNWMAGSMLDSDKSARAVFLFAPLRIFLLQVLKVKHRREWLREHMNVLRRPMSQVPFIADAIATGLSDGQLASAMWLGNSFLCRSLLARHDAHRILLLNGETLMSRPTQAVLAAAEFLGLAADDANRAALETLHPLTRHAKDTRLAYDAASRTAELQSAEAQCVDEVAAAMVWAGTVAADWLRECPFPVE